MLEHIIYFSKPFMLIVDDWFAWNNPTDVKKSAAP